MGKIFNLRNLSFDKSLLATFALLSIIVTAFFCFKTYYPLFKLYKVSSLGLTLSIGLIVIYFFRKSSTISLDIFDYMILAFFGVDLIVLFAHPLSLNSIMATALSLLLAVYYLLAKHIFRTKESLGIFNLTSFAASVFLSVVMVSDYISHGYNYYLTMGFFTNSGFNAILIAVTGAGGIMWFTRNFYGMSLWERTIAVLSVLVIVIAIVISQSRTALMSLLGVIILEVFLFYRTRVSRGILTAFLIMSLVGLCVVSYFLVNVKRPSAEGRFFLWSLSTRMIIENPLTGVGLDNFQYAFNEAQADYFKENPQSIFLNRAGDISNPFNDYIYITAERGKFLVDFRLL